MANTQSMTTSFLGEVLQGLHNFTASTGNDFKVALIKPSPSGTYDAKIAVLRQLLGRRARSRTTTPRQNGRALSKSSSLTP